MRVAKSCDTSTSYLEINYYQYVQNGEFADLYVSILAMKSSFQQLFYLYKEDTAFSGMVSFSNFIVKERFLPILMRVKLFFNVQCMYRELKNNGIKVL